MWDKQLEYLEQVVRSVNDNKSTLGFEILNEPQVFRQGDFKTVGIYHEYVLERLGTITDKTFFLCCSNSASLFAINLPEEQAKIKPPSTAHIKNNLIYDIHPYPPSLLTMTYYKTSSIIMNNMPMYAGEFNSSIKNGTTINENQFVDFVKRLRIFGALW